MIGNKSFKKLRAASGEFITSLLLTSLWACQSRMFDSCSADYRGHTWDRFLQGWPGSSTREEEGMTLSPCSIHRLLQPGLSPARHNREYFWRPALSSAQGADQSHRKIFGTNNGALAFSTYCSCISPPFGPFMPSSSAATFGLCALLPLLWLERCAIQPNVKSRR